MLVYEAEEGGFWGKVIGMPGCTTSGDTLDELLSNAGEAIEVWLASAIRIGLQPLPVPAEGILFPPYDMTEDGPIYAVVGLNPPVPKPLGLSA